MMIKIPLKPIYYKVEDLGNGMKRYLFSDEQKEGYKLHPYFENKNN